MAKEHDNIYKTINQLLLRSNIESKPLAAFYIQFPRGRDVYIILPHFREQVRKLEYNNNRIFVLDYFLLEKDVTEAQLWEHVAAQFLFPHKIITGDKIITDKKKQYLRKIILETLKILVEEHKIAALNLRIKPEYFLFEKLRRLSGVSPLIRREISQFTQYSEDILTLFQDNIHDFTEAAEELVSEGILTHYQGLFAVTEKAYNEMTSKTVLLDINKIERMIKNIFTDRSSLGASLKLFLENVENVPQVYLMSHIPKIPDSQDFLYLSTGIGLQRLNEQYDIIDFAKKFYEEAKFEVKKIGKTLNSTYHLIIRRDRDDVLEFFVKKYLNWTDVKWIVTRIWTLGIRNFSMLASSRMANEIYFVNFLREVGFNSPEIVHVNWRGYTLYQEYVHGRTLFDLWIAKHETRWDYAYKVGRLLAEVHSSGIVLGDCKPENFLIEENSGRIYVIDLEQASKKGDKAWDLTELLFYPGHYLDSRTAAEIAGRIASGYASTGDIEQLKKALSPKYLRVLAPWTPVWVQKAISDEIKTLLKS